MSTRHALAVLAATIALAVPAAAQEKPGPAATHSPTSTASTAPAAALAPTSAAPSMAPSADPAVAPTKGASPSVAKAAIFWGFVNFQYSRLDSPAPAKDSSTLETRRARIGARGDITPNVGYAILFDAADISLKDAYGALKNLAVPGLELRFGQWKTPFGYEQQESDTKLLWVNGSYVVQALARSTTTTSLTATPDGRDLGAGLVGRWLPAADGVGAEVAASVVNGAGPNRKDDLEEKNFWGRAGVAAKLAGSTLRAGGSYGYGHRLAGLGANAKFDGLGTPVDDTSFYFQTYGADVTLDTRYFFVATELIQSERDVWNDTTGRRPNVTARGWYAGLYGKTPWNVGPIFRAERFDRDRGTAGDRNERYTVGAYADLLPVNARLIFNYESDRSQKSVRTGDRAVLFGQVIF